MSKGGKSLFKNSVFFASYKVFNAVFPLVTSAYIARVLLPSGVGRIAIAQNIVTYFTYAAVLGMPVYGTREMARVRDKSSRNRVFTELFTINMISSLICSAAYYIMITRSSAFQNDTRLYLVLGSLIVFNIIDVDWVYQGFEEYQYIAVRSFAVKIVSFILTLLLVRKESDFIVYAVILCFATVGNYIFNIINLARKRYARIEFRNIAPRRHLKPLFILLFSSIAVELYTLVDTTMLGRMCDADIVGYYTNAMKIVKTIVICFVAISTVAAPKISGFYGRGEESAIKSLVSDMFDTMLVISLPTAVGLYCVAPQLIVLLFGTKFAPAILTIRILCVLMVPTTLSTFMGSHVLCSIDQENKMLMATILGALVNITLNAVLIPRFQQNGAAVASVVCETLVAVVDFVFVVRIVKPTFRRGDMMGTAAGALCMGAALLLIQARVPIQSNLGMLALKFAAGVLIYFAVLTLTKNSILKRLLGKLTNRRSH